MMTVDLIWTELKSRVRTAGSKVIYAALLLFFAYRRKDLPGWCRHIIMGAIAYLVTPIDAVPDLTPLLGYTDDLSVLSFALVHIAGYVDHEIRINARQQLFTWFPKTKLKDLQPVDKLI